MKLQLLIRPILVLVCLSVSAIFAQTDGHIAFNELKQDKKNNRVLLSITTNESFIVGAKRYVLHIGGKTFLQSEHPDGRLNEIIFYLPNTDFEQLEEATEMVLVYGYYHQNALQDGEGNSQNGYTGSHWRLGKFSKETLND